MRLHLYRTINSIELLRTDGKRNGKALGGHIRFIQNLPPPEVSYHQADFIIGNFGRENIL
jgi:hypothetical protein